MGVVFFALVHSGAWGATFEAGRAAYLDGNYRSAFEIWQALALDGDRAAQFGLGTLYHEGAGVAPDPALAVQWFRRSAEQGYPPAQFNLGNAYRRGDGVARDEPRANQWWRKAADQEFAPAQFNLATQYYFGRGVPRDVSIALIYYRRAAENGHPDARVLLARLEAGPRSRGLGQTSPERRPERHSERQSERQSERRPRLPAPSSRDGGQPTARVTPNGSGPVGRAEPARAPSKSLAASAPPASAATGGLVGNEWFLAQPGQFYTAQLLALGAENEAQAFVRKADWPHPVTILRSERKGRHFFSILYGVFESAAQASDAAAALGHEQRPGKPWIRKLAGVQRAMRKSRR